MLNPAHHVIQKHGGVHEVAALTGRHVSRVMRWSWPKERGGTGGLIPTDMQHLLMAGGRAKGVSLSAADFFDEDRIAGLVETLSKRDDEKPAA